MKPKTPKHSDFIEARVTTPKRKPLSLAVEVTSPKRKQQRLQTVMHGSRRGQKKRVP